jgi:hypothetical protein
MTLHKRIPQTRLVLKGGVFVPVEKVPIQFMMDRVALQWLGRASHLPGRALHLANAVVGLTRLQRSATVKMLPWILEEFNLTRKTFRVALGALEKAGLVSVERHRGRKPRITMLPLPAERSGHDRAGSEVPGTVDSAEAGVPTQHSRDLPPSSDPDPSL